MIANIKGGVHAPRAVLATAAEFPDVARAMGEYMWNSVQYKLDRAKPAQMKIRFGKDAKGKWFEVEDFPNGAGMNVEGLERYFAMFAPNEDRVRGNPGRGRNGTGKAAGLGVGTTLTVYSVKDGIANEFVLSKGDLLALETTYPCEKLPLDHAIINRRVPSVEPQNGTKVRVSGIAVDFDEHAVIRNLLRLFPRGILEASEIYWEQRGGKVVRVVKPRPSTMMEQEYESPPETHEHIGKVVLRIAASEMDLPRQEAGVSITSVGGNVMEDGYIDTTRRRSLVDKRIFGEVDVPLLDTPDSVGRHATTQARRLKLMRENERVTVLLGWIDDCINDFREKVESVIQSSMEEQDRAALSALSNTFERVLNHEYKKFMRDYQARMKLPKMSTIDGLPGIGVSSDGAPTDLGTGPMVFVPDPNGDATVVADPDGDIDIAGPGGNDGTGGMEPGTSGTKKGKLDPSGQPATRKPRGTGKARAGESLRVAHIGLGVGSPRAYYDGEGTFTINVDHPDFEALDKHDPEFAHRSAEGCAMTYAQAIIELRVKDGDPLVTKPIDAMNTYMDEHDKILRALIDACAMV